MAKSRKKAKQRPTANSALLELAKESPAARRQRVTSGAHCRAAVFENKKRKLKYQPVMDDDGNW